jgi:hypothetical protein
MFDAREIVILGVRVELTDHVHAILELPRAALDTLQLGSVFELIGLSHVVLVTACAALASATRWPHATQAGVVRVRQGPRSERNVFV